ncbi:MAG: ATP-binding protein [Deltaproteobacteria bacterium]|jgi:histidine kinase|nr:ATP-binding protein [Deltaproteobacteria bacterium]MDH3774705.1 ATP-binding protein [Deltaproteobacteria bacterium]MDH3803465.1 ATP-binding protein [Deltaproteobacteria bacterium]MDH3849720.1 ATP-binding protein [Deltaproteobacteria bacterium]MDH3898473.1 ATP-binding protein [Deltaproteobacteria bacterium]
MGKNERDSGTAQTLNNNDQLSAEIPKVNSELDKSVDEYQMLFDLVPCIITVQDKDYKLIRYNREFADKFDPQPGDYCYQAYKGLSQKCPVCPVEKTFEDGKSHWSEESGPDKDGRPSHWVVKSSPIQNSEGEIVAVMEMCLDITHRKELEQKLIISEKKYSSIFSNIPNPVFVLDLDSLEILDCNASVETVYACSKDDMTCRSFLDMFSEEDRDYYAIKLRTSTFLGQAKHKTKDGRTLYVNIRVSPSEYNGQKVLLVTTSDITKRLETEQQLLQASKMATLGEMATGVAHELNQPLAVMESASSFLMRKLNKKEDIEEEHLLIMAQKISSNVDRATRIINHLREFGRKEDAGLEKIQVNDLLRRANELLSQQLKVRGIEVVWQLAEGLPLIMTDPGRLEQVFVNLLLNARDAIEDKLSTKGIKKGSEKIILTTSSDGDKITIEVSDTGTGIPKDQLEKIFEPFFTTKSVGKGTGLGLSISYGIIKDCGGNIHVRSKKGEGARFIIEFPISNDS